MEKINKIFDSLIYNIIMGVLALAAVILALYDLIRGIQYPQIALLDKIIWIIFVVEYIIRFILSGNKRKFVISNIFDLIAIIPFNQAFMAFRFVRVTKILKLVRLAKLSKFTKLIAFSSRCLKRCRRFFDTNGFKYMLMISLIVIILGSIGIHYAENISYKDAIWWSFVTTATVGYGDIVLYTDAGRIIACILMLVGIGLIGSLTSTITSFFLNQNNNENSYKENEIENIKKSIDNIDNLTDEDIDNICNVLKALRNNNQ